MRRNEPGGFLPGFGVDAVQVDGEVRLLVRGEIDLATRLPLSDAVENAAARDRAVIVDLSEVTFIDSTGVDVLLRAVRRGVRISIANPQHTVRRVLEVCGVDGILHVTGNSSADERRTHGP